MKTGVVSVVFGLLLRPVASRLGFPVNSRLPGCCAELPSLSHF